jgi:hypothetical protein
MRSRRLTSIAGIAALAAMLFAQAAIALASCNSYRSQSHALMVAAQAAQPAPCHAPAENTGLCLAHCQSGDQTLDKHQVKVPELFVHPVLVLRGLPTQTARALVAARLPAPAAGPPPRILFQSLQI